MIAMLAHTVNQPEQAETAIANAHLIAAAPDMLEALEKARTVLSGLYRSGVDFDEDVFQIVGDAVRKAYGVR